MNRRCMDEIIVRSLQGNASDEQEEALAAWRRASPDNERHYSRIAEVWTLTGRIAPPVGLPEPPEVREVVEAATAANGAAVILLGTSSHGTSWRRWSLAVAALVVAAVGLARLIGRPAPAATPTVTERVNRGVEIDTVRLADGSVVVLAPQARMQASVTGAARQVWLDGTAEFSVARMPGRLFTV